MNSKQKTGIALMAIVFGLAISPALVSNDAEARFSVPQATLQGDLTAAQGDKPFGGEAVGNFYVHVQDTHTVIYVDFDSKPTPGTVYEGWLVDVDSGEKTSFGKFQENRNRNFITTVDNQFNNDLIVITPHSDSKLAISA